MLIINYSTLYVKVKKLRQALLRLRIPWTSSVLQSWCPVFIIVFHGHGLFFSFVLNPESERDFKWDAVCPGLLWVKPPSSFSHTWHLGKSWVLGTNMKPQVIWEQVSPCVDFRCKSLEDTMSFYAFWHFFLSYLHDHQVQFQRSTWESPQPTFGTLWCGCS